MQYTKKKIKTNEQCKKILENLFVWEILDIFSLVNFYK